MTDGSDGSRGMVHYSWGTADTRTAGAGILCAEFEATFAGGAVETFPNSGYILISVASDL